MGSDLGRSSPVGRIALWAVFFGIIGLIASAYFRPQVDQSGGGTGPAAIPDGFRTQGYSAPTPDRVPGARTVSTAEAQRLWAEKTTVFVDVQPFPGDGDPLHRNIPGSYWVPDAGYGVLAVESRANLRDILIKATHGDPGGAVLFYCRVDCWLSWNAAKRAIIMGYRNVLWYPHGTDGWRERNLPLVDGDPLLPF